MRGAHVRLHMGYRNKKDNKKVSRMIFTGTARRVRAAFGTKL